jgi:hypothetical protein
MPESRIRTYGREARSLLRCAYRASEELVKGDLRTCSTCGRHIISQPCLPNLVAMMK